MGDEDQGEMLAPCRHAYEGVDGTSRIRCRKCGDETTVEVLASLSVPDLLRLDSGNG